jgi:hypothetical protein
MPPRRQLDHCKKALEKGRAAKAAALGELGPSARVRRSRHLT